jgi:CRP/FNR family transcriptional regulator
LFRNLERRQLNSVADLTIRKFVPKGKWLFLSGDSPRGFFIVQTGSIKLSRISCEGREQVIHIFRTGESFGEESIVLDAGYPADACALEDSILLAVQKAGFVELLHRQPELSLCVLSAIAQHTSDLMDLIADLTLLDVQTRLAKWLVADHQQHGAHPDERGRCCVQLSLTKRVLATELGTSSETLSRTLAKLSHDGLVTVHGRRIILVSLAKLARLAEGNAESRPSPLSRQSEMS